VCKLQPSCVPLPHGHVCAHSHVGACQDPVGTQVHLWAQSRHARICSSCSLLRNPVSCLNALIECAPASANQARSQVRITLCGQELSCEVPPDQAHL
jgi:hypothetical protein